MESVFTLQNPETCCNVSSRHTLRDSRKCSLIMQHFIMRKGFSLLLAPPSFPLQCLPNPLPTMQSLPEDSEMVSKNFPNSLSIRNTSQHQEASLFVQPAFFLFLKRQKKAKQKPCIPTDKDIRLKQIQFFGSSYIQGQN